MRRIVMVAAPMHPVPPRHGAAVEWWMYQVSRRLRGYRPTIVCTHAEGYAPYEETEGVRYHRIRIGRVYRRLFQKITRLDPYSYVRRAARVIAQEGPEIVHVHNSPKLLTDMTRATKTERCRYILHMMNEMPVPQMPPHSSLIACSHSLARWYAARVSCPVDVVTNGADIEVFRPSWEVQQAVREHRDELGIPANRKVLLYAGRMSPEKGPLDFVLAFRELLRERDDIHLVLVGELRRGDPENLRVAYANAILAACDAVKSHCHIAGAIDPAQMQRYYVLGDLVVVPSEFDEPFGMVAVEAMAAGVPVLAAYKGGLTEYIREGETGFFIEDTKDHAGFARRMNALLNEPDRLDSIRRRARRYVEQHHSWDEVTRQLERVYARTLGIAQSETPAQAL